MTQIKKFAGYGASVAIAAFMAVALLVSQPAQIAFAADEAAGAITITPASAAAGATTSYTVVFTNGTAGGANNTVLAAADTITVDFSGAGATAQIQVLAATTVSLGAGFTNCTATVAAGGDGNAAVVTLAGAGCAVANDAAGVTFTLGNIRNGAAAAAASLGTIATNGAVDNVTATAATNTVAFTAINVNKTAGIGIGADVTSVSVNAGTVTINVYTAAANAAVTVTASQGVFNASNSATINCVDGTAACDQDGAANAVVSLLFINSGAAGTVTFTVSASGLQTTTTVTALGAASQITITPAATTMSSTAGTTNAITVTVKDGNGANVSNGTTVTLTTNLGTLAAPSQSTTATTTNGVATFTLTAQGAPGTATLTASVSGGVSQTATVTLAGLPATMTTRTEYDTNSANGVFAVASEVATGANPGATTITNGFRIWVQLKDSAGNNVAGVTPTVSTTAANTTISACSASSATGISTCVVTAAPTATALLGTAVPYTVSAIGANGVAVTVSGSFTTAAALATSSKVEVAAENMDPSTSQTVTVMVKDSSGRQVADGTTVTLVASAGAVVTNTAQTRSGSATFTFVSPGTAQSVNLTAVAGTVSGSKTISVAAGAAGQTPGGSGDGSLTAPTFGTGNVGAAVFNGGTVEALAAAVTGAGGTSVWAQTAEGNWVRYNTLATGATAFVNNAFNAAFANGFAGPTAVFAVK